MPKDVNVDLSTINSNEQISVEYIESDDLKEITISASNLSFNDIDQIIISENSSYVLSAYIIIIAVLITIHMVFLRFIFNN